MKKLILLPFILLFLVQTQNVLAKTDSFVVDNIEVNGEISENNYREKYIGAGFRKAFQSLIENILKKEDQKGLLSTDLKTIKALTENYRILEENIIGDEYTLKMEIKFSRNLLNDFFYKKNISYSEITKLNIIVYPILIADSEPLLFSQNKFIKDWNNEKDLKNVDFILPIENLDDINFIKNNLSDLEEINLDRLVQNYEIKNSAILIIRQNDKRLNVFLKTNFKGIKKSKKYDFNRGNLEDDSIRANVIKNLKSYINDTWKEQNLIDISVPSYLIVNAAIKSTKTLPKIIEKLENISLIDDFTFEQISKNNVKIKIKYFGKIKNLQDGFIDNGFKFKVLHNEWNLSLNI